MNHLAQTQLPDDVRSAGYKQVRPFHFEQVFENAQFKGTADEWVAAGLAYRYIQIDKFTRATL